jgi:light-harvesting complex 1 beta chain
MAEQKSIFAQSGLSEAEAKEIHGYFMTWFSVFLAFAIIAHALMLAYRPWIRPGETSMIDGAQSVATSLLTMLA